MPSTSPRRQHVLVVLETLSDASSAIAQLPDGQGRRGLTIDLVATWLVPPGHSWSGLSPLLVDRFSDCVNALPGALRPAPGEQGRLVRHTKGGRSPSQETFLDEPLSEVGYQASGHAWINLLVPEPGGVAGNVTHHCEAADYDMVIVGATDRMARRGPDGWKRRIACPVVMAT